MVEAGETAGVTIEGLQFRWLVWKSEKNLREEGVSHEDAAKMLMESEIGYGPNPSPEYPHQSLSVCLGPDGETFTIVYEDGFSLTHGEYTFITTLWKTKKAERRRLLDG